MNRREFSERDIQVNPPVGSRLPKAKETLTTNKVIKGAREVSGIVDWSAIGLLIFAAVIPTALAIWWGKPSSLPELVTLVLLGLYVFAVISTFAIIMLWGLRRLDLPDRFMSWLGGATVGEIVGLLAFIVRWVLKS